MGSEAREVFRQQCQEVRQILLLADRRKMALDASRTAAKMPSPNPIASPDVTRATTPSDLQAWLLSVQIAARKVGRKATWIMYRRLCGRARSAESSWQQIAFESEMAVADAKQIFHLAVPAFLTVLHARGVTTKYTSATPQPRAQCIRPDDASAILAIAKQVQRGVSRWKRQRQKQDPIAAA